MKRIVLVLLSILMAVTFSGRSKKAAVKKTIEGNMKIYCEMTDGTWMCDDHLYKYRIEMNGRKFSTKNTYKVAFNSYMASTIDVKSEDEGVSTFMTSEEMLIEFLRRHKEVDYQGVSRTK